MRENGKIKKKLVYIQIVNFRPNIFIKGKFSDLNAFKFLMNIFF